MVFASRTSVEILPSVRILQKSFQFGFAKEACAKPKRLFKNAFTNLSEYS